MDMWQRDIKHFCKWDEKEIYEIVHLKAIKR